MPRMPKPFAGVRIDTPRGQALVGTLIGNAPGFFLPFIVATHFGVGRATDVYALMLSVALFVSSVLSGVLEPNVLAVVRKARDMPGVASLIRKTTAQSVFVGLSFYVVASVVVWAVVLHREGWTPAQRTTALWLNLELSILAVAVAANSVRAAAYYAKDRFLVPTASQALRALPPLMAVGFLPRSLGGVEALVACIVMGELLRTLCLARGVRALGGGSERWHEDGKQLWRASGLHALNLGLLSLNPVVDRAVAATVATGATTIVDLAEKIFYVPMMVMTSFVLVAGADWAASTRHDPRLLASYRKNVRVAFRWSLLLGLGVGALLVASQPLLSRAIGHGDSVRVVAFAGLLVAGLPFEAVPVLTARLLIVTQQTTVLPLFALGAVAGNVAGDIVGAQLFGIYGIAVASLLVRLFNCVVFVSYSEMRLRRAGPKTSLPDGVLAGSR